MACYVHWFHIDKAERSTPIGARSIRHSMEKESYVDLQVWDLLLKVKVQIGEWGVGHGATATIHWLLDAQAALVDVVD